MVSVLINMNVPQCLAAQGTFRTIWQGTCFEPRG